MSGVSFSFANNGLAVHGDVVSDHGFSIGGLIDGSVTVTRGLLHVAQGAIIRGQAEGEHVCVEGTVEGGVRARLSLVVNGRVKGDIVYGGSIRLGPNVVLEGRIIRANAPEPITLAEPAQRAEPSEAVLQV
jgi:cytoskeletal protein CcmA (bactofilin family)